MCEIKFCSHHTSQKSDLYEFNMVLFYNGNPEESLLFISNFNMTLEASGTLAADVKVEYLCMLVHGESLRQFDAFSSELGSTTPENVMYVIFGLSTYFFLLIRCQKKSHIATRNEESMWFIGKTLNRLYD